MTEHRHPDDDALVEAALGTSQVDAVDEVRDHLAGCVRCRRVHAELLDAIDLALPAVPRALPPSGFESTVLERLSAAQSPTARTAGGARRAARWLPLAAAALLGVAVGAAGVQVLTDQPAPDPPAVVSARAVPLLGVDGADVGAVSRTHDDDGTRLVVVVHDDAPAGVYTCRVTLVDGTRQDVAEWPVSGYDEVAWVLDEPPPGVRSVELVGESGEVWAVADL